MERKSLVLIVSIFIGLAFLLVALSMIGGYNGLVNLDEDINSKYAQIEVSLQERHDNLSLLFLLIAVAVIIAIFLKRSSYLR